MAGPDTTEMEIETQFNQLKIETPLTTPIIRINGDKPVLIYSKDFIKMQDTMPRILGRATFVYELINAYELFEKVQLMPPQQITLNDLELFHSKDYIQVILQAEKEPLSGDEQIDLLYPEFRLGYDCPIFDTVFSFASSAVSGTLTAADCLLKGESMVAINWCGGWHHAQRDAASGYCYFNDIVLGIIKLHERYPRVLYIDLDLHHGDGVQNAFYYTDKVLTVSFHKHSADFYPGTGDVNEIGEGSGEYFSINIPLQDGLDDDTMIAIINHVLPNLHISYKPSAVVVQCGVDGLTSDPMDSFNLTANSYIQAINIIVNWKMPVLILGGGGYNFPNTAKAWTRITAMLCSISLNEDIPEHEQFIHYGPDFTLNISPGYRPNHNKKNYLTELMAKVQVLMEEMGKRV